MCVITNAWVRDKLLGALASVKLVYWATPSECGSLSNTTTTHVVTFFIHAEIKMCLSCAVLTRLPLVPHICASELCQHWSRQWLVAKLLPKQTLIYCELDPQNQTSVKFESKYKIFVHWKAFQIIVSEIEDILFRRRWINGDIFVL